MSILSPRGNRSEAADLPQMSDSNRTALQALPCAGAARRLARIPRRLHRRLMGGFVAILVACVVIGVAWATYSQPADVSIAGPIVPGSPLNITIDLDSGPAAVTVYSDPPGAVSYQGTINSGDTVAAATASSIDGSTVNVYVETDGETNIETATLVDD